MLEKKVVVEVSGEKEPSSGPHSFNAKQSWILAFHPNLNPLRFVTGPITSVWKALHSLFLFSESWACGLQAKTERMLTHTSAQETSMLPDHPIRGKGLPGREGSTSSIHYHSVCPRRPPPPSVHNSGGVLPEGKEG